MVQINFAQKSVTAKVVFYGPGMSGKTTNLEIIHQRAPEGNRGDLTSISTDGDRTLFFDFMPLDVGTVAGMRTCFQIYTVPGQVYYNSTRKLVLQGVDGIVFVADSSSSMVEENRESFRNLEENLAEYGKDLNTIPHVIQWNKRDLPDAMSCDELEQLFNKHNAPTFEAVANRGQGVFPTLKALAAIVLESIHSGRGGGGSGPAPMQIPDSAPAMGAPMPDPMGVQAAQPQVQPMQQGQQPVQQQPMHQQPAVAAQGQAPQPQMQQPQVQQQQMQQPVAQPQVQQPVAQQQHQSPQIQHNPQAGQLANTGFNPNATGIHRQPLQLNQQQPQQQPNLTQTQMQPQVMGHQATMQQPAPQQPVQQQGQNGNVTQMMGTAPVQQQSQAPAHPNQTTAQALNNMEGTRFRPRAASPAARPTPVTRKKSGGNWVYTAVFVTLALAVGGVVARIAMSFFF